MHMPRSALTAALLLALLPRGAPGGGQLASPSSRGAAVERYIEARKGEAKEELRSAGEGATRTPVPRGSTSSSLLPDVACSDIQDDVTRDDCWKAYQAYFRYYATGFEHRKRVIAWQHTSTIVIFFTVLTLVSAGIYFAAVQFHRGKTAGHGADLSHEVELSLGGIKARSPVLGVVVLALSLAFFYLYLMYVYPVVEIL